MRGFFSPGSIAVIGVSPRPGNLGRNIVVNLDDNGFSGPVYPVSPKGGEYRGRKVLKSISEIPETPDLAVILTPAATIPGFMRDLGEKGVKRVVIESGGFSELDGGRGVLEKEITDTAQKHGMRFIGPNCIGVMSTHDNLAVPFPRLPKIKRGNVSIVAQSGGVGLTYLQATVGLGMGVAKFASVGNKLNVNEQDLLRYLIDDPHTEIILLYLESIVAGREIFELIRNTDKPVVVHKSNIAPASNAIAKSHTAALANDDEVVGAALRQAGALRSLGVGHTMTILKGLTLPRAKGKKVMVISRSGGHAVVAADAAHRNNMALPQPPKEFLTQSAEHMRASVIKLQNPLDLGDLFDFSIYAKILKNALALKEVDSVLMLHGYRGVEAEAGREFVTRAGELCRKSHKPVAMCLFVEPEESALAAKASSLPVFATPEECMQALAANYEKPAPDPQPGPVSFDENLIRGILDKAAPDGSLPLSKALDLLRAAGVEVAPYEAVSSPKEALKAFAKLGSPVVIKAVGLNHKTEQGGLAFGLNDEAAVEQAARDMLAMPGVDRLVVMSQLEPRLELIVGGKQDAAFGALVLFGMGGIAAEAIKDTTLRLAPVGPGQAGGMMQSLRAKALFGEFRGRKAPDHEAVSRVISRISALMHQFPDIKELDINPLLADESGAVAVDARVSVNQAGNNK